MDCRTAMIQYLSKNGHDPRLGSDCGRNARTCIGAPLARKEATISVERLLARMSNIGLDEQFHEPEGDRHFD